MSLRAKPFLNSSNLVFPRQCDITSTILTNSLQIIIISRCDGGPRSAPLHFEVPYGANEALGERHLIAQPVALAGGAKVLHEIGDLDDVVHDLLPRFAIEVDLLCTRQTI